MGNPQETEGSNMPIEERHEDDRPKGPMSPSDDEATDTDGTGSMPVEEREDDDRPKGPMSP